MLFRTLCSIEFQDSCNKNVNVRRSEDYIFGIYRQRLSVDASFLHN
jgi:hypothetical protein